MDLSWKKPGVVAVGLNDRVPEWHDLYEIDIATGKRTLIEKNDQEIARLLPRLRPEAEARAEEQCRRHGDLPPRRRQVGEPAQDPQADSITSGVDRRRGERHDRVAADLRGTRQGRARARRHRHRQDHRARRRATRPTRPGLARAEDRQGRRPSRSTTSSPRSRCWIRPCRRTSTCSRRSSATVTRVTNRTLDDSMWTVVTDDAQAPAIAYLYDRKAGTVTKLFEQRPALAKAPLVPMQSLELKARDGLTLVSYLSLPPGSDKNGDGRPDKPGAAGAQRARRPVGARHLRLRQRAPVARESRLRRARGELSAARPASARTS